MSTITKKGVKEVVIEIDNTLEFKNPISTEIPCHFKANDGESEEETLERYKFERKAEFNKKTTNKSNTKGLELVRDCIGGEVRHMGYLGYLEQCWRNHVGIIFTPDILWQIFLTEVATHIKANAENYRGLFTDSDDKKEIIVMTGDPQLIDLRLIADELIKLTPTNTEMFLPEFTTTTFESSMAFKAAFADAMSPYYDYSMFLCGFPRVKLLGEESDWDKVIENINLFGEVIALPKYFENVTELANSIKSNISNPDKDFWNEMFSLKRCGSGSQVELNGWITKLYIERPRVPYVHNYPASLSFVKYKFINTGQNFELCYGLFSSNIEDGYLLPEFGYIINEIK